MTGKTGPGEVGVGLTASTDGRRPDLRFRGRLAWSLVAAAVISVVAASLAARGAVGNAVAAVRLAGLSDRVPGWVVPLAAVVAVVATALVGVYLAVGARRWLKVVLLALVALVPAVPGLAVGYANGTVDAVSGQSAAVAAVVEDTEKELDVALPHKPMTILLIGSDKSGAGDTGRSDTQLLVRLDPETRSISMLSLPRDLLVTIPGHGADKMNAAYVYGGPRLVVETFKKLTGLPINHFIEVDFAGFWHVVNILGGVYVPVDHRYYVPESADHKSIDLQPGYQVLRGHDALDFVRFRYDEYGDFSLMQRQQLFLKELQRQSGRWSGDWRKVLRMIRAITGETKSDLDSLRKLEPLVQLAFSVDTSRISAVHVEGSTPTIGGVSYVTASASQMAEAVRQFTHPRQAPIKASAAAVSRKLYRVMVHGAEPAAAANAAAQLRAHGYAAVASVDVAGQTTATAVYAPKGLRTQATLLGEMLWPADVRVVRRAPGVGDGITVFLGSSFHGAIVVPRGDGRGSGGSLLADGRVGWAAWRALDRKSPLRLQAPTAWASGSTWIQFRRYTLKDTSGRRLAAAVAVAETQQCGYWSVQAMRWTDPPAVKDPTATQTIGGRT
jgi:polyisoprenyl-teichoic acid--peptidoglycan teichoic acid transferase